jgi:predicted DNA-binding transcriptional regulator YafY
VFCRRHNGFYYRDPDWPLPTLRLTADEVVALFLAERALHAHRGTPYGAALASLLGKLTAALPGEVSLDLGRLGEGYSFRRQAQQPGDAAMFRRLARAVQEGRRLELDYWSASRGEACRRVVDPYHLAELEGDWYLVAYCHLREEVRMFVPGRVRSLKETGERFERPADFRIGVYLDGTFRAVRGEGEPVKVRVRFAPAAARYVRERQWHPSQKLQELRGGGVVVTLRVDHLLEVKRWALSYGPLAEVLEPEGLRQEVQEELRQALDLYR